MRSEWEVPVSHAKVMLCMLCMLYTNEKATTCLLNTHCVTKVTSTKLCSCTNCIECFGAIVLWTKNGCLSNRTL